MEACSSNQIPKITDPLGKYWDQPDPNTFQFSLSHVWMPESAFKELKEYSRTNPTGVYAGKMWKALMRDGGRTRYWFLRWYEYKDEQYCWIRSLRIGLLYE